MEILILGSVICLLSFICGVYVTVIVSRYYANNFAVKPTMEAMQKRNKSPIINDDLAKEEEQWSLNMTDKEYAEYTKQKYEGRLE